MVWMIIFTLLVAILAVVFARTALFHSRQMHALTADDIRINLDLAVKRLSGAIRIRTLSFVEIGEVDSEPFICFREYLEKQFPLVHARLKREIIAENSLLYTWQGKDSTLLPVLMMAHMDVVPVVEEAGKPWTQPAYGGDVQDGFIWGRGTLDDKGSLLGLLEAVENLLENGFTPQRTLMLTFGHDEEIGGIKGAAAVSQVLTDRGVRFEYVLDEGGAIVDEFIGKMSVAALGIAEKGYVTVKLTKEGDGGHSSQPPEHTTIGQLSAAIQRIEAHPRGLHPGGVLGLMLDYLGPEMSFPVRLFLANRWLFGPLVNWFLVRQPSIKPMMQTTQAVTMISAGIKDNILPPSASAAVNCRILPGETVEQMVQHLRKSANDADLKVEPILDFCVEPSPISPISSRAFLDVQKSISQIFPKTIVAPYLVLGGTDSKHFQNLSESVFRFSPTAMHVSDLARLHGRDERISVKAYQDSIIFYVQLMKNTLV